MSRYPLFDVSRIRLRPLSERGHDLSASACLPLRRPEAAFEHPEFPSLIQRISGTTIDTTVTITIVPTMSSKAP